jgi:hypothetical protein
MAKTKAYTVLRAFPARHKETGEEVWITRENEHLIPEILTTARIKAGVESEALAEYETGGATPLGATAPAAKSTRTKE